MTQRPLLAWLDAPSPERGIRFAGAGDQWELCTYETIARLAARMSDGLLQHGVRPGDVVALLGRSGPELVAALFGTMSIGATPSLLAPPLAFQDRDLYVAHLRSALGSARPRLIVADADLAADLGEFIGGIGRLVGAEALLAAATREVRPAGPGSAEIALLQFTSGSSGEARGVRVAFGALEANVGAIRDWLGWRGDDAFVSWLPLYHDMGLIGALISSVVGGGDLWLLRPEQFVRDPLRYLRCMSDTGAALTVTPNFGLDFIVRRVAPEALRGIDLGRLRRIVVGAERIDARTLEAFLELLAPCGLRRRCLVPAYGLAEATLAVTGLPRSEEWVGEEVDPESLAPGKKIRRSTSGAPSAATVVVGCGRSLSGVSVAVVDEDGRELADGYVGEIVVRGRSLAAGYSSASGSSPTALCDGELRTGDAGFLLDGQLFVLGRLGDSIKIRGRTVFSEDLEVALGAVGVSRQRIAVLLGVHRGVPAAVLVSEEEGPAWKAAAEALLRSRAEGARVETVLVGKGAIARTSSGKPKRRQLWQAWVSGSLAGTGKSPGNPLTDDGGHGVGSR